MDGQRDGWSHMQMDKQINTHTHNGQMDAQGMICRVRNGRTLQMKGEQNAGRYR